MATTSLNIKTFTLKYEKEVKGGDLCAFLFPHANVSSRFEFLAEESSFSQRWSAKQGEEGGNGASELSPG